MFSSPVRRWIPGLLAAAFLAAAQEPAPTYDKPQGYVSDFAHVIDAASRTSVEDYLGGLERVTGVQVAVVTVASLNGEPIEDFANTLMRKWGVGQKGTNEGLLMVFAIRDRKMRIEVGYGLEPVLTDGYVGSVQRSLREELRAGKYGDAVLKCVQTIGDTISKAKGLEQGVTPLAGGPRAGPPEPDFPIGFIVSVVVVVYFLVQTFGGGRSSGRRYYGGGGPYIGGGGWGGGGFGGSSGGGDSGGGFGGFGGGDSGGGGASSDW
jgi:uncharacterized protein